MFKIDKTEEPCFFINFKRRHSNEIKTWDDMNNHYEVKRDLRIHMLTEEQNCLCPYCEAFIESEDNSSIEHIKPRDSFNNLMLEYNNFITSCKSRYSCDNYKGRQWDEKFINPVEENPKEYFKYDLFTGEIIPKEKNGIKYDKAIKTIEILNLNHSIIVRLRKIYIIQMMKDQLENLDNYPEYSSLVEFYKDSI